MKSRGRNSIRTEQQQKEIAQCYLTDAALTAKDVAIRYGISVSTVFNYVRKHYPGYPEALLKQRGR